MQLDRLQAQILSVGHYLPETVVKSSDLIDEIGPENFGISSDLIQKRVGVAQMRHSAASEKPSDMAIAAAEVALKKAPIKREEIDHIIFCGVEGDYVEPSTAHWVQKALGLKPRTSCFDISNACLGFTTAMQVGNALIASGGAKYVLIVTGEKLSNLTQLVIRELQKCKSKSILSRKLGFLTVGDAGGAVLLAPSSGNNGFVHFGARSLGQHVEHCKYRVVDGILDGQMIMERICAAGLRAHEEMFAPNMERLGWAPELLDCVITHQVGQKPFTRLSEIFSVAEDKMTKTFDYLGNIATATFPVNLGLYASKLKPGSKVFAAMTGSGLAVTQFGMVV